jgi:hypothetical protein
MARMSARRSASTELDGMNRFAVLVRPVLVARIYGVGLNCLAYDTKLDRVAPQVSRLRLLTGGHKHKEEMNILFSCLFFMKKEQNAYKYTHHT